MNSLKSREIWIDYSKCILIYFVIAAHAGNIGENADVLICAFHMPAFFIISGYLSKVKNNGKELLYGLFMRIIIPTVFFFVLLFLLNAVRLYIKGVVDINEIIFLPLSSWICDPSYEKKVLIQGLWFLQILFLCKIILEFILRFDSYFKLISFVCVDFFVLFLLKDFNGVFCYYFQRILFCLPYLILGYLLKKICLVSKMSWSNSYYRNIIVLLCIVLYCLCALWNGRCGIQSWAFGHGVVYFYLISIIGCMVFFYITKKFFVSSHFIIEFISKNTFSILCLHRFFLNYTSFIHNGFIRAAFIIILMLPSLYVLNKYIPLLIGNRR